MSDLKVGRAPRELRETLDGNFTMFCSRTGQLTFLHGSSDKNLLCQTNCVPVQKVPKEDYHKGCELLLDLLV